MSNPDSPARGGAIVLLATVLLTGLAGGALCCLLALMLKQEPAWPMLPIGIGIGAFMRWQRFGSTRGAVAAVIAALICVAYTEYLYAAVRMADMLGFPLRDTFFKMDWRLAWQIVWGNAGTWHVLIMAAAPVAAGLIASRRTKS